jgi:hypothetical protein
MRAGKRIWVAVLAGYLVLGAALAVLAIDYQNLSHQLTASQARVALLQRTAGTAKASGTPSVATVSTVTSPVASAGASAVPTAPTCPGSPQLPTGDNSPQILLACDSLGNVWLNQPIPQGPIPAIAGSTLVLTAIAKDPQNRPIQYRFWTGVAPQETLLRDWSPDPSYAWVVKGQSACVPDCDYVRINIGIMVTGAAQPMQCYLADPCSGEMGVGPYNVRAAG